MLKRVLLTIVGVAGTAGLVGVLRYHPAKHVAATTKPAVVAVASSTPALAPTPVPTPVTTPKPTATPIPTATPGATATPTPVATHSATPTPSPTPTPSGPYHNGTYTGSVASTDYGSVQVSATVAGGYITNITFLRMPSGGNSTIITSQAKPVLLSETLQAQSASINTVSGATQTSAGYKASLAAALAQA